MPDTPAIAAVEQCRVILNGIGLVHVAVVRAARNKWDLVFRNLDRTTVLIRVSEQNDPSDQVELSTIAAQQTFQRIVLVAPDIQPSPTQSFQVCPTELLPDFRSLKDAVSS